MIFSNEPLSSAYCDKNAKDIRVKYFISHQETLDIQKFAKDPGVLLYQHYLRMASMKNPIITDSNAARSLGWTSRKAQRYRQLLTNNGYFKQISFTRPDGQKMVNYHIGKESVSKLPQKVVANPGSKPLSKSNSQVYLKSLKN